MQSIRLRIVDKNGAVLGTSPEGESTSLVYGEEYHPGDQIMLECREPGCYCMVQFEDTLAPALIFMARREIQYHIPFEEERIVFSPKSFTGSKHLIRARMARPEEIAARRNLAFNPYDQHGDNGFYPHTQANVETRGEAVFAAYNAIDGMYENASHGAWPYQSWGINRDPKAEWKLSFGHPVVLDELRLTLRADFPHDSWWTQATVAFSDGSEMTLDFQKTGAAQRFSISPRKVEWLILKNLIKAEDLSPFPALTQFEAWGTISE